MAIDIEMDLINRALEQRDVIPRLRTPRPTFLRIEEKRDESHHARHVLVCRGRRARGSGAARPSYTTRQAGAGATAS